MIIDSDAKVPFVTNLKNLKVPSVCSDELISFNDVSKSSVRNTSAIDVINVTLTSDRDA